MSDSNDTKVAGANRRLHSVDSSLTERQRTILNVIRESVTTRGYPPSIREIGDAVGLTSTSMSGRGGLGRPRFDSAAAPFESHGSP